MCLFPSGRLIDNMRWGLHGKRERLSEEAVAMLAREFPTINYFFLEEA